jgi:hypothetical protein
MFIIYDSAACIIVALIAATLLCTAYAIFLLLTSGASRVSWKLQKLTQGARSAIPDNFPGRTLGKPLAPVQVPLDYRGERRK